MTGSGTSLEPDAARRAPASSRRVVMLLENNPYPDDVRVRLEAEALAEAGHRVTVLAPRASGQPRRERIAGVDVTRFHLPPERATIAGLLVEYGVAHVQLIARAVWHLIKGAQVVHLHNPPDTLFPAGLIARALGRRVVFDNHDLTPELFETKFGAKRVVAALLRRAQRTSMRLADLVVASNESQAEVAAANRGERRGEVVVVRNGPRSRDLAEEPATRTGALAEPRLVYLGQLAAQDGVTELADLLSALRERHGLLASLTVIGDGPARAELERALVRRGMLERTRFHGWVPFHRVPALLADADVCIDPAPCSPLNHRSTMTKIAEYLAAARPVVAYDLTETRRTVGDAALLAPCGDHQGFAELVAQLAASSDARGDLIDRALARRTELVWERSARVLIDAYGRL